MDQGLYHNQYQQVIDRRHSLSHGLGSDEDLFLQRYQNLRKQLSGNTASHYHTRTSSLSRPRPQSLDRGAYKSALRNSFSSQTLMGLNDRGVAHRGNQMMIQSLLTNGRKKIGGDTYSDSEVYYESPNSILAGVRGRAGRLIPSSSLLANIAGSTVAEIATASLRSSSLPRHSALAGALGSSRTAALNQRLAQLEQFYAATAAAARRHSYLKQQNTIGGTKSTRTQGRPHSALAGTYTREEYVDDVTSRRGMLNYINNYIIFYFYFLMSVSSFYTVI